MEGKLYSAFRAIIPKPEDQTPLTISIWPQLLLPPISLIFMAYLVQRPNTQLLRTLFFPVPFLSSLRLAYGIMLIGPEFALYNMIKTYFVTGMAVKAFDFLIFYEDNQRVKSNEKHANGGFKNEEARHTIIPIAVLNAIDAACDLRGLNYNYGKGVHIPAEKRPSSKIPFILATCRRLIEQFLVVDFLDSCWKLLPLFQDPNGRSIYLNKPWPEWFLIAFVINMSSGYVLRGLFQIFHFMLALFGVIVFRNATTAWPPLFDGPFTSQSFHYFWAKGWHQILRRTFMVVGGMPGQWLGRRLGFRRGLGLLVGTFLGSSMYHEIPYYLIGRGFDKRMPGFFLMHGSFVFMERIWRRVTGRAVTGFPGWLWGCSVMLLFGQSVFDSWHSRGFGGSLIIPPAISPTRRLLFPLIYPLLKNIRPDWVARVAEYVSTLK